MEHRRSRGAFGTRVTGWRRIASAMWGPPDDPQIFGALDIDAAPLLAYIERARAAGHRVTPTHLVGRALGHVLAEVPDLNVQIRGGHARPRPSVDVFFITAVAGGRDLSGVKIEDVPRRSAIEVADELTRRSTAMKRGDDRDFERTKRLTDRTPPWLLRRLLRLTALVTEDLGLDVPMLALRKSPFGSAMVTSVGAFGLPHGFAPLAWMYDVPILVLVGELTPRPVVVDGAVVARTVLPVTTTIDHRYVDGWHVSKAMKAFKAYLAAPEAYEPAMADHREEGEGVGVGVEEKGSTRPEERGERGDREERAERGEERSSSRSASPGAEGSASTTVR